MPHLIWSPKSLKDIERLHHFLASKSRVAAQKAVSKIRSGVKLLENHPEVGRVMENMASEFREWPINFGATGYLVLYYYDGENVIILTIKHKREMDYWHDG